MITLALDAQAIEPGGTITGVATVDTRTEDARDDRLLHVRLCWETRGRGDTDQQTVANHTLPIGRRASMRFELIAPFAPITFSGALISVIYFVEASIASHPTSRAEVVIAPGGVEVVLAPA